MSPKAKEALDKSILQFLGTLIFSGIVTGGIVLISNRTLPWIAPMYFGSILILTPVYLLGAPGYFRRKYPEALN